MINHCEGREVGGAGKERERSTRRICNAVGGKGRQSRSQRHKDPGAVALQRGKGRGSATEGRETTRGGLLQHVISYDGSAEMKEL